MFESIQDFRKFATEEDYKDLESYILKQSSRAKAFPCDDYHFSYSSAAKCLKEHGYLGGQCTSQNKDKPKRPVVPTKPTNPSDCITRSFSVPKSILERLDRVCDDNWQYTRKTVFLVLLDAALQQYGY